MESALILSGSISGEQAYAALSHGDENRCVFEEIQMVPDNGKWKFTYPNGIIPIACLVFIDDQRKLVDQPQINQKLYLGTLGTLGRYLPLQVDQGELVFQDVGPNDRTLYLQVPTGSNFKFNDIRGRNWIQVGGKPLTSLLQIDLSPMRLSLSPMKNGILDPNNTQVIVGDPCLGDCTGRKCTEVNNCGQVCGCPVGFVCNPETGFCERTGPCVADGSCGAENGKCPGICPQGQKCIRDVNGFWKCLPNLIQSTNTIIFLIGVLIIIILFIIVIALWMKRQ